MLMIPKSYLHPLKSVHLNVSVENRALKTQKLDLKMMCQRKSCRRAFRKGNRPEARAVPEAGREVIGAEGNGQLG